MPEHLNFPHTDSVTPVSMTKDITDRASNREDENTPKVYPKGTMTMMPAHEAGMLATADDNRQFVGK